MLFPFRTLVALTRAFLGRKKYDRTFPTCNLTGVFSLAAPACFSTATFPRTNLIGSFSALTPFFCRQVRPDRSRLHFFRKHKEGK